MGIQQSNERSEGHSSHQPGGSSTATHSHIHGDNSGNSDSNNNIITINNNHCDHKDTKLSQNHDEILRCLYTSRYEEHRRRVREPVDGTCSWVTEHPKYKDWLEKKASSLLWLSADPGCGKSVIASFLVGHLQRQTDATVCYFFFKDDFDEQRSATFALCAVLHQIFKQRGHLIEFAEEEFRAKGSKFTQEVDTLWDILVRAVAEWRCGEVICVVDALDECEEETLAPLIHHITRLSGSQSFDIPLRFLVTSRPYHKIERELGSPTTTIRLKGEDEVGAITADVNRVIDEGVKDLESYWEKPAGLGYLRDLLESSADRTFLWVSLILSILKDSEDDSREEFTNIVSSAPSDLAGLYNKILDKSANPDKGRRILHIVMAAARPLTLAEMHAAFRTTRDHRSIEGLGDLPSGFERTVKNLCGLFIRVIDSKVYLVHQTAREFLLKELSPGLGNWQYTLCPRYSNFVLADICISYLSLEEFENNPLEIHTNGRAAQREVEDYLKKYAFLGYAARHWVDHFRDSQDLQMELFELTRRICGMGSGLFLTWFAVYRLGSGKTIGGSQDLTHLMVASLLGQGAVVERLSEEGDINARCRRYGTAVNIAAIRKDEDMTRMLLQKNAKAYINGKECDILNMKRSELEVLEEEKYVGYYYMRKGSYLEPLEEQQGYGVDEFKSSSYIEGFKRADYSNYVEYLAIRFLKRFCIRDTPDERRSPNNDTTPLS